jgi:hypothetical protein
MARRKTPILLREGPLSGRVAAITRYTRTQFNGRDVIRAIDKYDVNDDFETLMLMRLFGDPKRDCPDIVAILDGAAEGEKLNDGERTQLRVFHDRLRELVLRENDRIDERKSA